MAATHRDYDWIETWADGLFREAYCLSLVQAMEPRELLDRLAVDAPSAVTGAEMTVEPAYAAWDVHDGDGCYVAVTQVEGWALMLEPNGYIGVTEAIVAPLSRRRRLVSHFRNVNAVDHFYWYEDGLLRVHFEPLFPTARDGPDGEALRPTLTDVGFDLSEDPERPPQHHTQAAFALAERLTSVAITPALLTTSEFLCGIAPLPDRPR
jgi:hypothetical protein